MLIVLGFIAFIFLSAFLFNDNFNQRPHDLFGINKVEHTN